MLTLCLVLGFICEPHNNPADFFLDVINGDYSVLSQHKPEDNAGLYLTHMYTHTHSRTLIQSDESA